MLPTTIGLLDSKGSMITGSREELMTTEQLKRIYQVPLTLTYLSDLQRYTCQIRL